MDVKKLEEMVKELEGISNELNEVQKEITRDVTDRITSIQRMIDSLSEGSMGRSPVGPREIIMEKAVARLTIRDNGETVFEGLY
jgi:hypothetical protein